MPEIIRVDRPNPNAGNVIRVDAPNPNAPKPNALFSGIGQKIAPLKRAISENIAEVRATPLEAVAPLFTEARQGDIPFVSDIFPGTRGIVPKLIRPLTTGVGAGIDAIVGLERMLTEGVAGALGEDPELSPGQRFRRGFEEDRIPSARTIKGFSKLMEPAMQDWLEAGVPPEKISAFIRDMGAALGTGVDVLSGEAIFRALSAPGKIARGAQRATRLKSVKATRAAQQAQRATQQAQRAQRELTRLGGDPAQLRLPAPTPGARPSIAQPTVGPISGKGFVIDQPGFKRQIPGPTVKGIEEITGARRVAPRVGGEIIEAEAKVSGPFRPSREARISAAEPKKSITAKLKDKRGELSIPEKKELDELLISKFLRGERELSVADRARIKVLQRRQEAPIVKGVMGKKGEAVFGRPPKKGPKGESAVARRARERLEAQKVAIPVKPTVVIPAGEIAPKKVKVKKSKKLFDFEKEALDVRAVKVADDTKVGNIPVGKLLKKGEITSEQAQLFVKAGKMNPAMIRKLERVSDVSRKSAKITPKMVQMVNDFVDLTPAQRFSIGDVKLDLAMKIMDRPGDPVERLSAATDAIQDYILMRNALGGALRAAGKPRNAPTYIGKLRKLLDDADVPKNIRAEVEGIIEKLEGNVDLVSWFDVAHEVGINNMLAGTVTMKRNLFGNMIGVGLQPGDKIGQALTSFLLPGKISRHKASFAEIGAEISAMLKSLPSATKEGVKFAAFGDASNIISYLGVRLRQIRSKPGPATAKDLAKVRQIIKSINKAVRQGRIGTRLSEVRPKGGQAFDAMRKFGPKFVREHPKFSAAFDITGAIANIPSRLLVGADKFFQTISEAGKVASKKVRVAMEANPKTWRQSVKDIKLTKRQLADAVDESLEYVYRDAIRNDPIFGETLGAIENVIRDARVAGIPIGKAFFPFFKTSTKLIRFAVTHSPLGAIEQVLSTVIKKGPSGAAQVTARGLDAKQMGKALNGSLVLLGSYAWVKKHGGRFVGVAKTKEQRDVTRMQNLEEMRIEWLDKKGKVRGTTPISNLSPASPFGAVAAWMEQKERRIAAGEPAADVKASEMNSFFKSMLQQSVYNNINEINRASQNLFDEKVPTDSSGNADLGSLNDGWARYWRRFLAGRAIPNELREIKRTGKFLGVDVAEKERAIFAARTTVEEVRSGIPKFKGAVGKLQDAFPFLTDKDIPTRVDFTGETALRSERVSLVELLSGGRKPSEDPVLKEFQRLKLFPAQAPRSKTIAGIKTRLTEDERRQFLRNMKPKLMKVLTKVVESEEYKAKDDVTKAKQLEKVFRFFRAGSGLVTGVEAFKRQIKSKAGKKQIRFDVLKGRSPFPPKK